MLQFERLAARRVAARERGDAGRGCGGRRRLLGHRSPSLLTGPPLLSSGSETHGLDGYLKTVKYCPRTSSGADGRRLVPQVSVISDQQARPSLSKEP